MAPLVVENRSVNFNGYWKEVYLTTSGVGTAGNFLSSSGIGVSHVVHADATVSGSPGSAIGMVFNSSDGSNSSSGDLFLDSDTNDQTLFLRVTGR